MEAPAADDPLRGYGNAETRRLIQSVLDRLPARYGDVLEWKYIEGRSVEEIGELLGIERGSGPIGAGASPHLIQGGTGDGIRLDGAGHPGDPTWRSEPMKGDDTGIEELLRQVGARDEPSPDVMRRGSGRGACQWQSMLRARRTRRQFIAVGIAASALLAVGVGFFGVRYMAAAPIQVAQITRIDGHLLVRPQSQAAHEVAIAANVSTGETIQTDDRSRAALQFGDAVSLRLDQGTIVKIAAADELVLTAGALYIDSQAENPQELTVRTDAGSVRHVGTQYEVRTHADEMVVSVREGRVMIAKTRPARAAASQASKSAQRRAGQIARAPSLRTMRTGNGSRRPRRSSTSTITRSPCSSNGSRARPAARSCTHRAKRRAWRAG